MQPGAGKLSHPLLLNHFRGSAMTKTLILAGAAAVLLALPATAHADVNCSLKDASINGNDFGGNPFNVPARIGGPAPDPNIGLSAEDCVAQNLDREFNRAAALGAIVEFYPDGDGWHANLAVANGDANASAFAGGLNLMYTHDMRNGPFDSIRFGGSAGSTFEGEDQVYALTVGVNWGGSRGSHKK